MIRFGWVFKALGAEERVIAIVRGTPPFWIVDIPGAGAWALYQAGSKAEPGSSFRSDCWPYVDTIPEGKTVSCFAKRPLARSNGLMHHVMDDASQNSVVWMPAHTLEASVAVDRKTNDRADEQAKKATRAARAPAELRQDCDDYPQNIQDAGFCLGMVTWPAGNIQGLVKRDFGASAFKALQHRSVQKALAKERRNETTVRLPSDGGHLLVSDGPLQWCALCGTKGLIHQIG